MNTATSTSTATTITLNEGFFARRNWLDWLFAAIVAVGGLYALQRYGAFMDVYEKGILPVSYTHLTLPTTPYV